MRPVAGGASRTNGAGPGAGGQERPAARANGTGAGSRRGGGTAGGPRAPGGRAGAARAPGQGDGKSGGGITVLAVLVGVALTLTACLGGPPAIADGQAAHGFSLPPLLNSGKRISLSDYPNQPVILNFCAAWSQPCTVETKVLQLFYRRHPGLVIIGIDSQDSRAAGLRQLTAAGVQYPVAYDPTLAVGRLYGVPGIPTTYFLNSQHQIIKTNLGWLSIHKLQRAKVIMDASPSTPAP